MEDRDKQADWGSWEQTEEWRKQSFLARTPAQRLQWLKAALVLAYDSGALHMPGQPKEQDERDSSHQ